MAAMLLYTYMQNILTRMYFPSVYDPKADSIQHDLVKNKGFLKEHLKTPSGPTFGDLSLMSINLYTTKRLNEGNQRVKVTHLVDQHHPAILGLQAVTHKQLQMIKDSLKGHYEMVGDSQINIDLRTRKRERRPIFYDKHVVELIKEGSFTPFHLKEHAYATFAVLRMKTNPDMIFTVVNADLYSGNEKHIEKQMYNMIKHINDGSYGKHPLFFLGMINEQTTLVRSLVKNSMNNAVALDTNNTTLSKTTFHNFGRLDDGKQRDFILLKDDEKKFKLNYARILSKLERVDLTHYPVYAIYTMN